MLGRPLIRYDAVTSTMAVLTALAVAGAAEGTTVVAGFQTAGRGRADRQWIAPPNGAVLMSVLLRPDIPLRGLTPLSLLSADAIAAVAREQYGLDAAIKWPNDVLVCGRKLSGVLIQTRTQEDGLAVIVGMGINANVASADLPLTATSLMAELGAPVDLDVSRQRVLVALETRYRELQAGDLGRRWGRIQDRIAMRGELVSVREGPVVVTGVLSRVDSDGALVLDQDGQERRVMVGDLVRGPSQVAGS